MLAENLHIRQSEGFGECHIQAEVARPAERIAGDSRNRRDARGSTPLQTAREEPAYRDMVRLLQQHGAHEYRELDPRRELLWRVRTFFDVYDAAAWSAPGPLSEISVAKGSAPVRFPDSIVWESLYEVPSCALLLPYLRSSRASALFPRPLIGH